MKCAEIIAIGSEMLLGGRLDTNSVFLTERLGTLGMTVRWKSIVGDEDRDIAEALMIAVGRADVILLTGGLGPTRDDCTRRAVARAVGRPLIRRKEAVESIRQRLALWGRAPTSGQLRQALIPAGADILPNPIGSAPGFAFRWNDRFVCAIPGVPKEAERMFEVGVVPKLSREVGRMALRIERRVLHTFGLSESEVDGRLHGLTRQVPGCRLGLLASPLGVLVSLTATARPALLRQRLAAGVRAVNRRLQGFVYAEGMETMEAVVGRELSKQGLTLAVAESCTGGLIGHRLTAVPGSSAYFDRGVMCYSNEAKQALLGVSRRLLATYGAVSAPVALAMARGVRTRSGTHIGLSVTGIAGPGGGTALKPVGLVYVGLDAAGKAARVGRAVAQEFRFHGDRETIKLRASQAALNVLRHGLVACGRTGRR